MQKIISSNFKDIFADLPLKDAEKSIELKADWIETILGPMLAIADDNFLYLLEFITRRGLKKEITRLGMRGFTITPGESAPICSIKNELSEYFAGTLTKFKTPYRVFGSQFQQQVWQKLCDIPFGETISYREQAISLCKPSAYRAVANANGANQLAIIIPCHRVIASDGTLGGYGGGLMIKQRLLEHEKLYKRE